MNSFKIIGNTKDLRTNTNILYAQISLSEYLEFVGEDFDRFEIQRRRENHKGYSRMKSDIIKGTHACATFSRWCTAFRRLCLHTLKGISLF